MAKRGQGSNCFNNDELQKYHNNYDPCMECGCNQSSDFHHNTGRSHPHSDSILNAVRLCRACHVLHGKITRPENQNKYFRKILYTLMPQGYKFNANDKQYIVYNFDLFHATLKECTKTFS